MAILHDTNNNSLPDIDKRIFIFHVDLDCFFAAVEMREDPSLANKPLIVGADKETKRGVVLTCNYEARTYGIHSGMSAMKAIELCSEVMCVRGRHSLYREASENIMTILSNYTDKFRSASIDEAYLDLTEEVLAEYDGNPIPIAEQIKKEIFENEHITCSIGIGPNTTIAKMATSQAKPNGIKYVPKENIQSFLSPLPIEKIIGIGMKTATRFKQKYGIETIGQIIELETEYAMIRKFGDSGKFFYRIISGQGRTKIEPEDYFGAKSISKGRTFYGSIEDGEKVTAEKMLPRLIDSVHERLTKRYFRFKTVSLEVKLQRGLRTLIKSRSFLAANDDKERISLTIFELLEEFRQEYKDEPIRKVAVRVSNFEKTDPNQRSITDFFNAPKF